MENRRIPMTATELAINCAALAFCGGFLIGYAFKGVEQRIIEREARLIKMQAVISQQPESGTSESGIK